MSDNLVFELLHSIRADVGEIKLDILDMKHRLTTLGIAVANLAATEASHHANLSGCSDRTEERLARIERRLELPIAAS